MDHRNSIKWLAFVLVWLPLLPGCLEDVDLSGFIYSSVSVDERYEQSMQENALTGIHHIELDTNAYSFSAIGDIHVGGTINLDEFLEQVNASDVSFITIAGDLSTGHQEDMEVVSSHLESNTTLPYFPVTGNHDLYFEGWDAYYRIFGSSSYTLTVHSRDTTDLFIFLDSGSATLGEKQTKWLKNILTHTRHQYRYCTIITHTNFFRAHRTTSTNPLVDELYVLLDLFSDHQVNLVIMGHDHRRSEERFGPTTYVTLDALLDGFKQASYLKLNVSETGISYDFKTL